MDRRRLYSAARNNIGLKLLALLVAVFLWIYVNLVADHSWRPRDEQVLPGLTGRGREP